MELSPIVAKAIVQRYARLVSRLGGELGDRPLVLPTKEFFPDQFTQDQRSLTRLVKRMQKHAGIEDIPIRAVLQGEPGEAGGNCSTGACGVGTQGQTAPDAPRIVDAGEAWVLNVPAAEVKHPVVLTANLARALASIFLAETQDEESPLDEPVDVTVDLTAVALGFGVLQMQGSYIYSKSCGGPSVAKVTSLGPTELGVALGTFIGRGRHSFKAALKELDVTQKAALAEAKDLLESNESVLVSLREAPLRLAEGDFQLEEPKPWLLRAFGRGKAKAERAPDELSLEEMESLLAVRSVSGKPAVAAPKKKSKDDDELGAMVAEALREAHR